MILVSGANRHDSKMFERCVDAIPAIAGLPGRPRRRPAKLHADKVERRLDIHEALLKLAAAIICARFVDRWC